MLPVRDDVMVFPPADYISKTENGSDLQMEDFEFVFVSYLTKRAQTTVLII